MDENFSELEVITNDLLAQVRDLEYYIQIFGDKSTTSNALKVRNLLRDFSNSSNSFRKTSIDVFKSD